ncbi:hypothetical protein DL240_18270 [Lujinxingia litoralis]|uniref:DUF4403 domain-containing protein n=1 Tax=Lujinxingia litoralis TaxID=2211119 RepID=A0A328C6M9_9DELT|nr:hypothetical protein [Lujinxingia litoralis]RAL20164.1 hypothetical protein DL240_18270 [Lujinxingia litoralis]
MKKVAWRNNLAWFGGAGVGMGACVAAVMALSAGTGCEMAQANCGDVESDYEQAVQAESGLGELDVHGEPQLAMALRMDMVNGLANKVLSTVLSETLDFEGTLPVSGTQGVSFNVARPSLQVELEASSACDTCVRMKGDWGGDFGVTIPVLGRQSSPLSGSVDWTVPLSVERDANGEVAIFFDSPAAVRMGAPRITGSIESLPSTWSRTLEPALMRLVQERLADEVPKVRIAGYAMPNFGVAGLEFAPTLFKLDNRSNALILGVRTNLDAPGSDVAKLSSALSLSEGQNVALGVQPGLIVESVRLAMREEKIARRYSLTGDERSDGPTYAVVDSLQVGSASESAVPLGLDFRLFNHGAGWGCFSMDGRAVSALKVEDGQVSLDLEKVEFTGSRLADAANWGASQFVTRTQGLLTAALNDEVVVGSEMGVSVRSNQVGAGAGMLVLKGQGSTAE